MSERQAETVIVGGGIAGLACARTLQAGGLDCVIFEASDRVGGRVATDEVDGFLLDRGFQVYLPAYRHAGALLDLDALDLAPFYSGALLRRGKKIDRIADVWRHPVDGLRGAPAVFKPADMLRIAWLRFSQLRGWRSAVDGRTTLEYLQAKGFSSDAIDSFFRPFFSGVFLETELATPASFFEFVFEMFSRGGTAVPAKGMGKVAETMAAPLKTGTVALNSPVASIEDDGVGLADGRRIACRNVVLACDAHRARELDSGVLRAGWNAATTVYYAADRAPFAEPILMLGGKGEGPITNVVVPSNVSKAYAPPGASLIAVTAAGRSASRDPGLEAELMRQLERWYGPAAASWERLAVYDIPRALPHIETFGRSATDSYLQLGPGRYACGDYLGWPSIDGAAASGVGAARALIAASNVR